MNILFSSAGRRVGLMGCFRRALGDLRLAGKLIAVDAALDAPALQAADAAFRVPRCDQSDFIDGLLEICWSEQVDAVIPTIDTELLALAAARDRFAAAGVRLWASSTRAIAIADDKRLTHERLTARGLPTPAQCDLSQALADPLGWPAPLIVKPARGSASIRVQRIEDRSELCVYVRKSQDMIVQSVAPGDEFTVHVWADADGRSACVAPCKRLEVRAGEVSKALTVKDPGLMGLAAAAAEALPGARGPLNVQIFQDADGSMRIIEINARFGGGYPLADQAGATFARWLIEETIGRRPAIAFDAWRDELAMLRFDEAFFVPGSSLSLRECQPDQNTAAAARL